MKSRVYSRRTVEYRGEVIPVPELARRHNIPTTTLYGRLRRLGPDPDPALLTRPPLTKAEAGLQGKYKSPWKGTMNDPELTTLLKALEESEQRTRSLQNCITKRRRQIAQELEARARVDADRSKAADLERREIRARPRMID